MLQKRELHVLCRIEGASSFNIPSQVKRYLFQSPPSIWRDRGGGGGFKEKSKKGGEDKERYYRG